MSQHDYQIANAPGAAVRSDINNALQALITFNSGDSAPATPYAYEMYVDTSPLPGSDPIVYIRNGANNAWARWGYINKTTGKLIPDYATDASGFGSGVKMLFYQDTAPTGWVILNTLDDKLLYVTKGSAAGGQTGGTVHSSGTWTQPNHTHSGPSHTHPGTSHTHSIPSHVHPVVLPSDTFMDTGSERGPIAQTLISGSAGAGATGAGGTEATGAGGTGVTGGGATANTWRPAAYCAIICQRS